MELVDLKLRDDVSKLDFRAAGWDGLERIRSLGQYRIQSFFVWIQ